MTHYFTIIGCHLECVIQPELVVKLEFVLFLVDFGTILSYARKTRKGSRTLTLCQGQWSCRAKNSFPKLISISLNYTFPAPTVQC